MPPTRCKNCGSENITVRRDTYGKAFASQLQLNAQLRTDIGKIGGLLVVPILRAALGRRVFCRDCEWERQAWR